MIVLKHLRLTFVALCLVFTIGYQPSALGAPGLDDMVLVPAGEFMMGAPKKAAAFRMNVLFGSST